MPALRTIRGSNGKEITVNRAAPNAPSVLYDVAFVPGGGSVTLLTQFGPAIHFVNEAYSHGKAIAAVGEGVELLAKTAVPAAGHAPADEGLITGSDPKDVLTKLSPQ